MKEDFGTKTQRAYHRQRATVNKKRMKPVRWNGMEFESMAALARHHKAEFCSSITNCIRGKRPYKGYMVEFIKKGFKDDKGSNQDGNQ